MTSRSNTFRLTFSAVMAALSLAILFLANTVFSGKWAIAAIAGLCPAAAVISVGLPGGFGCWAVAGALGLLLLPDKLTALVYALFFGVYPMIKSLLEQSKSKWLCFLGKLAFFNAVAALLLTVFGRLFLPALPWDMGQHLHLVFLWGNPVFIAYDYGLTKLLTLYMARVGRKSRKEGTI